MSTVNSVSTEVIIANIARQWSDTRRFGSATGRDFLGLAVFAEMLNEVIESRECK